MGGDLLGAGRLGVGVGTEAVEVLAVSYAIGRRTSVPKPSTHRSLTQFLPTALVRSYARATTASHAKELT